MLFPSLLLISRDHRQHNTGSRHACTHHCAPQQTAGPWPCNAKP